MENEASALSASEGELFGAILDLQPGETVIAVLRRSMASYFLSHLMGAVAFWVIIVVAQAILFLGFGAFLDPWVRGIVEAVFFYVIVAWGIGFTMMLVVGKPFVQGHYYFITSKKLLIFRRFVRVLVREIEFKRITDLVLRQSLWGRVANFGTLFPVTAGVEFNLYGMQVFTIEGVRDVFEVRKLILAQVKRVHDEIRQAYKSKVPVHGQGDEAGPRV